MRAGRVVELLKKYARCPKCGKGLTSTEIYDDVFIGKCKCGWEITIDDSKKG